jgi:integrase
VLWEQYERACNDAPADTLDWLMGEYFKSTKAAKLIERTRTDYASYARRIGSFKTADGRRFGDSPLRAITQRTIAGYLDKYPAPIAANRHIQFLKAAWNVVKRTNDIPDNPCLGVDLNEQRPRDRCPSLAEIKAVRSLAAGYLPMMIDLAYLCRARRSEIAAMRHGNILEHGLLVDRTKGSDSEITAWTPALRQTVAQCKAFNAGAPTPIDSAYLIHDKRGRPISKNTFDTAWQRLMAKAVAQGIERFTFHDLKSAGYSDQKIQWAGHKSERMHRVYNRRLRVIDPADFG